jgi:hypothetical protein
MLLVKIFGFIVLAQLFMGLIEAIFSGPKPVKTGDPLLESLAAKMNAPKVRKPKVTS